jgi:hypothetical protein
MPKHIRFLTSAAFVAAFLVSILILSVPVRVSACEDAPPANLLALYTGSDLIVVANLTGEKDGKITSDETDYYFIEVNRSLRVSSVLKGKTKSNLSFTQTEFRFKNQQPEQTEQTEEEQYYPYGYKWHQKLQVGERYLIFLRKNPETRQYELTDETSGARKLNDYELSVHEKRIEELKSIAAKKENQLAALNEWILRCVEEEATRWDGVMMLSNSFEALEYGSHEEQTEKPENKPFVIDKDFNGYTPEIAKTLTDSQKERVSSVLFGTIGQNLFENESDGFNYVFAYVVKKWDKTRLAMYAFSILQTTDKAESEKTEKLINYIASILGDEELYKIIESYQNAEISPENEDAAEPVKATVSLENAESAAVEQIVPTVQQAEIKQIELVKPEENADKSDKLIEIQPEAEKLTPEQKREKALQDFIKRYEYLLARGFPNTNSETTESSVENKPQP